jgi:myosin heavy subunit
MDIKNKVIVSPDSMILDVFMGVSASGKPGMLSSHIEIDTDIDLKLDIEQLVNHPKGNVDIVFLKPTDKKVLLVTLLLPSLSNYIALHIIKEPTTTEQIKILVKKWQQYFQACQQLLLIYPETFEAKDVSSTEHITLRESIQHTLFSDPQFTQLHGDWTTYIAEKNDEFRPITQSLAELGVKLTEAVILKTSLDALQKDYNQSKQQHTQSLSAKDITIAELSKQQQHAQTDNQQLTKNLTDKTQQYQKSTALNETLQSELESSVKVNKAVQQQLKLEKSKSDNGQQLAKDAQASLIKNQKLLEQKTIEFTETQIQNQQIKKQLKQQTQDSEKSTLQIARLEEVTASQSLKIETLNNKLEQTKKQHTDQHHQIEQKNKTTNDAIKSENELLVLQTAQLQEELESQFLQGNTLQKSLSDTKKQNASQQQQIEQQNKTNQTANKAFKTDNDKLVSKIAQLQKDASNQTLNKETLKNNQAETKRQYAAHQQQLEQKSKANGIMKTENELLVLQITQLQEELEYYYLEFNKIKKTSGTQENTDLIDYKNEVQARYPQMVTAQKCIVTGGFDRAPIHRVNLKFEQVSNFNEHWSSFNVVLNDRKGAIDIEFQAPDDKRIYPLATFIKTGNNKVNDYTLISPHTIKGLNTYNQLPDSDQALLKSILNEIIVKLTTQTITALGPGKDVELNLWLNKVQKLLKDLQTPGKMSQQESSQKSATPLAAPTQKTADKIIKKVISSSLGNITLLQNMVAQNNEHLSIRVKDLKIGAAHFPIYELKIGAKKIHPENFTKLGSLEFRELKNNKAPLFDWAPEQSDKWGPKLTLDITPNPTKPQQAVLASLSERNQEFIMTLLTLIAENVSKMDTGKHKLNQPVSHWHQLLKSMLQSFNHG